MKKLFASAIFIIALSACNKETTITVYPNQTVCTTCTLTSSNDLPVVIPPICGTPQQVQDSIRLLYKQNNAYAYWSCTNPQ